MIYGMSKAVFHKYGLNEYQDEYFRRMQAPNPLFLKRMDDFSDIRELYPDTPSDAPGEIGVAAFSFEGS